ncbi:DMT family transporter [Butyrivibrio sp. AE2032]|uniref:DMT family transporter n=1 Tax=Butyrivibrio sp. AE2032 TaxID=1458463 RepID=UPI00068C8FE3|nr:DMT family transporter [Butyrivibrio sp. AE2032]
MGSTKTKSGALGDILIIIAGLFWGSMGIFVRHLNGLGFTSIQVACLRLTMAGLIFAVILLIKDPKGFKINPKDIPLFLALGLVSILFFTCCYFTAIRLMTMSTAAILLYTSPIWVMILAIIFLKEKISLQKVIALILAFAGCVLVSGFGGKVTLGGILAGLGSGLGYGLYSIFGTFALKKYTPYTVTCYTFLIAGAGSVFVADPADLFSKIANTESKLGLLGFVVLTSVVTAVIPFLLYTLGLNRTTAGKAAVLATIEPVAATLFGVFVMKESIGVIAVLGILLVLGAIAVLSVKKGHSEPA